jgi:acyl-CoA reductase-like NAD-dependent aldehyde dehydrogenase
MITHSSDITTVIDPSTGSAYRQVPLIHGDGAQVIVDRANAAQLGWSAIPVSARARLLSRAAEEMEVRRESLVADLAHEGGKPLTEARGEVDKSIDTFRYYAGLASALDGRAFAGGRVGLRHETRIEPLGTVLAITPWNVPMASPARKIAPALLAGDAVIVKPAELTPLSSLNMRDVLLHVGVPEDVVQVATGSGSSLGAALVDAHGVDAISFTGSTAIGLGIKDRLSQQLIRVQLELGGKNAAIVWPDANLDDAVRWITAGAFAGAGQQCTGTSRVIVHRDVVGQFLALLDAAIDQILVGDIRDPAATMGPLISVDHRTTVHGFVERAAKEGARVMRGGVIPDGPGSFYPPTLISGASLTSEINVEEVFGPVLSVIVVDDLDTALEAANGTVYGLSAAVHTRDLAVAEACVSRIDAGVVAVNGPTAGIELPAPFGGFKLSGTDSKEHGPESLRFYTRTKLASWGQP